MLHCYGIALPGGEVDRVLARNLISGKNRHTGLRMRRASTQVQRIDSLLLLVD
jgi:hypothetical protein